jgi:uncharacterized membrane protein (DUF4010 family)
MLREPWFNLAVATALGLLIGLERERGKGRGPGRGAAGMRTFGLAALAGAVAIHLGGAMLLAVLLAGVMALAGLAYLRAGREDPGLTTEVALAATPLLGALAMANPALAAALAAIVTALLAAKPHLHRFATMGLSAEELHDGLVFAVIALVLWPLLPDVGLGPWQAVNPHRAGQLVVLVLAIGAVGHVASRVVGARYGLPLSGLASGFVSSTATIGAMATRASREPASRDAAVAGATLSTLGTFIQMALLLWATSTAALLAVAPALAAGGVVAALYGAAFTGQALRAGPEPPAQTGRAFSLRTALVLAATLVVMLLAAAGLGAWLGDIGIVIGGALAGIVDPHAAAISVASLVAAGRLPPPEAALAVLAAMSTNTASKGIMAFSAGAPGFAWRVVPGLALSLAATWVAALFGPG